MTTPPEGYELREGPPPIDQYLGLRERSGLSPRTREQAEAGIDGAWYAVHVVHTATGEATAMGRVLGDGGWYFHIIDMAVLPEHQRRGLGNVVLTALLERIQRVAPPGAYINLLADEPGRVLYRRHGFVDSAPVSVGMVQVQA
ncbi:GNAT family N-acetyltransferase [Kineosporia succinea]|uniref:GNAT superfamily N-acetyltransferase n=1 Tax=Kineosporia succinea TaxID=84632 RepID=A0ABT9PDX4_9ACTN|nr:GNAT family N-acetyltransferase [Kineosporia succinea]MDP9830901.1 GNAT superfamily N-acetyltransferase [Kineosporia succinea]